MRNKLKLFSLALCALLLCACAGDTAEPETMGVSDTETTVALTETTAESDKTETTPVTETLPEPTTIETTIATIAETTTLPPETTTLPPETTTVATTVETTTVTVITTTTAATTTAPVVSIVPEEYQALADNIFKYTNDCRRAAGVPEVKKYTPLSNAAQVRANECLKSFSHTRPDGREYNTVLSDLGIKNLFRNFGENQATWGTSSDTDMPSAKYIVYDEWMKSKKGHKENMLAANWTHMGIGVSSYQKNGNTYWFFVQFFAETKNGVTL